MTKQICVARIGAAHGVRGAVKLWIFTEDPLAVLRYGPLTTKDGAHHFTVAHGRRAILHRGGDTRIDQRSSLRRLVRRRDHKQSADGEKAENFRQIHMNSPSGAR